MLISVKEKKNRPTDVLNNLRPLTPLNVHYKIATMAIAHRVAKVLPDVKSKWNSLCKDRYIGENFRLINYAIEFTQTKKTFCVEILLEFEKAFDSIEWEYLSKVLEVYQFKDDSKEWLKFFIQMWQVASQTVALDLPFYNLKRELRKGFPSSGLLFVYRSNLREETLLFFAVQITT